MAREAADTFVIGDLPISVDIGDLDGDGDLDIATICENDSGDRVLRVIQNMLIESGQFALVVLSSDDLEGQEPFLLRVADIDNDASEIEDVVALTSSTSLIGGAEGFNAILSLGNVVDCLEDLNDDKQVDAADLGLLLAAWGLDGETDLNEDGSTDAADLGLILAAWGPCGDGAT